MIYAKMFNDCGPTGKAFKIGELSIRVRARALRELAEFFSAQADIVEAKQDVEGLWKTHHVHVDEELASLIDCDINIGLPHPVE